ncbi:MAG TPA: hypothetical protein GX506_04170 [Firmicutes bacterium]|nr:hypothetical protein [Bacillota bacterium]
MSAKEPEGQGIRPTDSPKATTQPGETGGRPVEAGRDWGLILFLSSILIGLLGGLWWLVRATFH